jgi:Ca-activated chloride channel family protein
LAEQARIDGGVNRVLLATDGDFNVGVSDVGQLRELIAAKRRPGITLTTLGFGTGNYQEALMEQIADVGNGNYAYIDGLAEARKVLVNEMNSTLFTIAQDVKVQVEFNPAKVAEYRLIGFENRVLQRADFNNDRVDAGDIGAGHTVTALYEIVPAGGRGSVDPLRYGSTAATPASPDAAEFAFLKLRYKLPGQDSSRLIEQPLAAGLLHGSGSIEASADLRFAAAVAAVGQILRGGKHTGGFDYGDVLELARGARGDDPLGYRAGFLTLVDLARGLQGS